MAGHGLAEALCEVQFELMAKYADPFDGVFLFARRPSPRV